MEGSEKHIWCVYATAKECFSIIRDYVAELEWMAVVHIDRMAKSNRSEAPLVDRYYFWGWNQAKPCNNHAFEVHIGPFFAKLVVLNLTDDPFTI
mmetsp:Transcript_20668/g.26349  ORF Transcript_20668/g.26349 Transcript_20668/m.26349 type:complete len:94 (-) Transcript_20668:249-530(-)